MAKGLRPETLVIGILRLESLNNPRVFRPGSVKLESKLILRLKSMAKQFKILSSALIIAVASTILGSAKIAQAEPFGYNPVADEFNRRFFEASGDFYQSVSVQGYTNDILGIGSPAGISAFPEKQIERDGSQLHGLYREMMEQQASNDPIIRVPDAINPFNSSLLGLPPGQ
jgi:hypothetical protein